MNRRHLLLISTALLAVGLHGCDRQRSNPIDPESSRIDERPATPQGLVAEAGVNRVLLSWQPVDDQDLAGYAVYRAVRSDGEYEFVAAGEDSTTRISTGKTTFIDSVAAAGQTFFYRVAAVDTTGHVSELSGFVGATVLSDNIPPQAPQNLSAVADENEVGRIVLRWSPPTLDADGGELTGLAGFVVFRSEVGTGGLAPIDTLGTDIREYIDEGLKALSDYSYSVMAFDDAGNESQLAASSRTRTQGLPSPTRLAAIGEIGRIILQWEATEAAELLGYNVYRSTRSDTGYVRLVGLEGTPFTTGQTSYVDSGLVAESQFFYRVEAVGSGGLISQQTGFVGATARSDEVPPRAPGNLSAIPDESNFGRVTLSWSAPVTDADGGELTGLEGFVVLRSEVGTASFIAVDTLSAGVREYVDEDLKALTTYAYTVVAFDGSGNESGQAAAVETRTQGVEIPSGLQAGGEIGRVVLTWTAVEAEGLRGYNLFRSTRSDQGYARLTGVEGTPFTTGQTTFVDSGLAGGDRFFYQVTAVTASAESDRSGFVSAEVVADEVSPTAPRNLSAVPDESDFGRVTLSWSAPVTDADGGELSGLSGFVVLRSEGGTASFVALDTLSADVRTYVDEGLKALTTYAYTVIAFDDAGNESGQASSVSTRTQGVQVPSGLSAQGGIGRVVLSWSAVDVEGLQGYNVFRSTRSDQGYVRLTGVEATPFTTGQTTYVDSNLTGGARFFYRVVAVTVSAESVQSGFVSAEVLADEVPPRAPGNLSAISDESNFGRVTLSWTAPVLDADGGELTGLEGFVVLRSEGGTASFVVVDTLTVGVREYVDEGLKALTTYAYTVVAFDAAGNESGQASSVSTRTQGVQIPSGLRAGGEIGRVVLTWTAVEAEGLQGYNLFRSTRSDQGYVRLTGVEGTPFTTGQTTFVDSGLAGGDRFFYQVTAVTASAESDRSGFVSAEVVSDEVSPTAPRNLSAVPDESDFGRVTLSWSAPVTDAGGGELSGLAGFVVLRSEGGTTSFVVLDTLGAAARSYVDEGLKALTTYAYTVIAFDDAGNESGQASPVSTQTQGVEVPSGLSAQGGIGRVVLSWRAVQVEGLQGYNLYRSTRSDQGYMRLQGVEGTPFTTGQTTFVDSGLAGGDRFFYQVTAVTASAESDRSGFFSAEVVSDEVSPTAPRNLSAVPDETDFSRVTLSWSAPVTDADGGELSGLSGFVVLRSEGGTTSFVALDTLSADARTYVDAGLKALTTYAYTVVAFDNAGNESGQASAVLTQTRGVEVPGGLRAEGGIGRVVLSWSAVQAEGLQGYNVFRSTRSDQGFARLTGVEGTPFTTGQTTYVDSNLTGGARFFYRIVAVTAAAESAQTGFVSAEVLVDEVPPSTPSNLSAVPDESNFSRVTLSWTTPVTDTGGGELSGLTGYLVFRSLGGTASFVQVAQVSAPGYEDLNLEPSKTYFYTVVAVDAFGNQSARAASVSVRTNGPDQVPPSSPVNLSAVPDESDVGRVTLSWSAPVTDADGGELTGLSGFVVLRSEGGTTSFVVLDTLGAEVRSYADQGLKALTTYAYTVIAFDDAGNESGQASPVSTQTQGVEVPSGLNARGGIGLVVLSWTGVFVEGLQGYDLYRSTRSDQGYTRLTGVEGTPFTTGQTTYIDSNLTGGDRFFYRVVAVTASAQSEQSEFVSAEVLTDEVPPAAPENLLAVPDESDFTTVTLIWSAPTTDSDGGELSDLSSYIVLRSKDSASAVVPIDTVDAPVTQFVDSGLDEATTYFYSISAVDETGNTSTLSISAFATTGGISRPTSVRAASGIKQIVVTWSASSDSELQGYNVYRSTRSDQDYSRLTGVENTPFTTGQTTYVDSGLTGGATFFYRVSAVATDGESDQSSFVGATVQSDNRGPAAPTFVEGRPVTGDPEQLSITWKAPTTDSNGSALTGLDSYLIYRSDASDGQFTLVGNSNATSFVDTGLTAQTTYFYEVEAADTDGNVSPRSTTISATTGGVDVPANVTLSSTTPSDAAQSPVVTVRWEASSGAILNYDVQRTTVANSTNDADYVGVGSSNLNLFREDNTVTRGLTYYYRVRARDVDSRVSDWTTPLAVTVSN